MNNSSKTSSLLQDLFLPTILFAALGGMTWAVRGCSGYGAVNGCVFAGVTWGAAWWFISRDPGGAPSRRHASSWIILAMSLGIGMAGARGWMQWPSFFRGELLLDAPNNKFVPIPKEYGFLWLFIAGVPWAGLGACMLAWCGARRDDGRASTRQIVDDWALRIVCGVGAVMIANWLFARFPEIFLPLYKSLKSQYNDLIANPNLKRLIGDNRLAVGHMGLYLGFLLAEVIRRDWKNVTLISTVGLLNGAGWALCQNWNWAHKAFPGIDFNWWRCWESSGGISIGIAYGVAYYLVNRPDAGTAKFAYRIPSPNLERFGVYFGLLAALGFSIKNGLKGCANIYIGNEAYWSRLLSLILFPAVLVLLTVVAMRIALSPQRRDSDDDPIPEAAWLIWITLIIQNVLAQLVTGPHSNWTENVFCLYYLGLFLVSGLVVRHYQTRQRRQISLLESERRRLAKTARPQ
jgi:hypothetical protein